MAPKKPKKIEASRNDGYANSILGIGDAKLDASLATTINSSRPSDGALRAMYSNDHLARLIVDTLPDEMTRAGFSVSVEGDTEAAEKADQMLAELKASEKLNKALRLNRLFGGCVVFLGVNDGETNLEKPLEPLRVKSLDFLTVFESSEATPVTWVANPFDKNYGEPEIFTITPAALGVGARSLLTRVHRSRLLIFTNGQLTNYQKIEANGYGDSVLQPMLDLVKDYGITWRSISMVLQKFCMPLFKVAGLKDAIASGRDSYLKTRLQGIRLSMSTIRGTVIDKDEDFEMKTVPLTGISELMDRFASQIASAARMPVTLLFGQSPSGLNATGNGEARQWYDQVSAAQKKELLPALNRLCEVLFASKLGPTKGNIPELWSIKFNPLWQASEKEQAEIRQIMANVDAVYLQNDVLIRDEVRNSRFSGDTFNIETNLDQEKFDDYEAVSAEEAAAARNPVSE